MLLFSAIVTTSMLLSICASAQAVGQVADESAEIRNLEEALFRALHARNREELEGRLTPDYVLRGAPDLDRATWLQNATTLCWGDRSDIDAFRARRLGDVAIASFELTFYTDPSTCQPATLRSLITDVWVRQEDRWKLQLRHAAAPPSPDAKLTNQFAALPERPPAWEGSGELSLVATGGNSSTRSIGAGAQLVHRGGSTTTKGAAAFLTSEADAVTNAQSVTMRLRHGVAVAQRVQLFAEASYLRDRFAGIDDRSTVTAGLAYSPSLRSSHTLNLQSGIGLTIEQRLDATRPRFATASGAMDYDWTITPGSEFSEHFAVNADLESATNWRMENTAALRLTLTRVLAIKASHSVEYRHTPVAGFGRADVRTAIAVVLSLRGGTKTP